jgi:hypothetical protein
MSNYLIDINNIDKFIFDNIIIGTKIYTSDINSKNYLYYNDNKSSPKDIYIRLPKIRLIYKLANPKYTQLSIPLYPNWNDIYTMIKFIKKLEKYIIGKIDSVNEYSNIISNKNKIHFLKTNYDENNIKITSNLNQNKILLSDFKINGEIEMVIKLDYIWVKNKKCGLSINLYQIKYYSPATQNNIDFIDENIPTILIPKPPIIPNSILLEPEKPILKNIPKLNISSKDLKNAIKKLKPIE